MAAEQPVDTRVTITFRKHSNGRISVLLPMLNGVDIPDVIRCTIDEGVGTHQVTLVCNLPHGVLVEP